MIKTTADANVRYRGATGKVAFNEDERAVLAANGYSKEDFVKLLSAVCVGYRWYGIDSGRSKRNGDSNCLYASKLKSRKPGQSEAHFGRIRKLLLHRDERIYAIIRCYPKSGPTLGDVMDGDCPDALTGCYLGRCYGRQYHQVDPIDLSLELVTANRLMASALFVTSADGSMFAIALQERFAHD